MKRVLPLIVCGVATARLSGGISDVSCTATSETAPRYAAAMAHDSKGMMFVHGGCADPCCTKILSDSAVFSDSTAAAVPLAATGRPPGALAYHTATPGAEPGTFYVYGGLLPGLGVSSGLYHVLVSSASGPLGQVFWRGAGAGQSPPPRYLHSQVALGNDGSFLVYGGKNTYDTHGDVWLLDGVTGVWRCLADSPPAFRHERSLQPMLAPDARHGHAAATYTDIAGVRWMLIFGGTDDAQSDLGDLWAFNINRRTWLQLQSTPPPPQRSLFTWQLPRPAERHGHVMWVDTSATNFLRLIIGGGKHGVLDSDPLLHADWWRFEAVAVNASEPYLPAHLELQKGAQAEGTGRFYRVKPAPEVPPFVFAAAAPVAPQQAGGGGGGGGRHMTEQQLQQMQQKQVEDQVQEQEQQLQPASTRTVAEIRRLLDDPPRAGPPTALWILGGMAGSCAADDGGQRVLAKVWKCEAMLEASTL